MQNTTLVSRIKSLWANSVLLLVCMGIGLRLGPSLLSEASEHLRTPFAWPLRFFGGTLLGLVGGFAWFWYEERRDPALVPIPLRA